MKKYLISILCLLIWFVSSAQTFDPTKGTVSNKPYSPAQSVPTDARAYFYDAPNFLWRPYQNPTEVLTFLNLPKYRGGNVIYVVDSGGTLNSNGTYTNFHATFYMFADGTADVNLIKLNLTTPGGGSGIGTVTNVSATNGSGVTFTITNPTTTPNISVVTASGGDVSGALNNITVNKFNGQLPSFYLNYNNLFNTPTIPAQLNPSCVGCSITGSYPNLTWTVTGSGFTTAGVDLIALSSSTVGLDTLNYRKVDSVYGVNDSTFNYVLNGVTHTIQVRGGNKGGGGGTGTVTVVTGVNANGVSFSITNPTSTPAITITLGAITPSTVNGLTLTAAADGFTIQGGTVSRTLTVTGGNATVRGTNTGDVTLAGENYLSLSAQIITANSVNVSGTNITGILKAASFPAQTGDVTNSAGALATTISAGAVTFSKMANLAAHSVIGNNTASPAVPIAETMTQLTADLNLATTTLQGLVTPPGSVSGKVYSDAMTWVVNGTGNTNSNVGSAFRWAIPGTNNIKTFAAGFGTIIDSITSNTITIKVDTSVIAIKGIDSIFVKNYGPATSATVAQLGFASGDTVGFKKLIAGANVSFTLNNDSSLVITATGGGSGGITGVGLINSQASSSNVLVISGNTIYTQFATNLVPGEVSTAAQIFAGQKSFTAAPIFTTMTNNGGTLFTNGTGVVTQGNSGTATQVWHGGVSPQMAALNLASDVIGVTSTINGGTGTASPAITAGPNITITGTFPNYTISAASLGTVTSVSASGGTSGIVITVTNPTTTPLLTVSGTLNVSGGGIGQSSLAPFDVLIGGSTPTSSIQQVSGEGTLNYYLASNGALAAPSWKIIPAFASAPTGLPGNMLYLTSGFGAATTSAKFDSTNALFRFGTNQSIQTHQTIGVSVYGVISGSNAPGFFVFDGSHPNSVWSNPGTAGLLDAVMVNIGFDSALLISSTANIAFFPGGTGSPTSLVLLKSGRLVIGTSLSTHDTLRKFTFGGSLKVSDSVIFSKLPNEAVLAGTDSVLIKDINGVVFAVPQSAISGGGGAVGTWEQVLVQGSTLSTNHNIGYSGHTLQWSGTNATDMFFNNGIEVNGFVQHSAAVTASSNLTQNDNVLSVDATGGARTQTLPNSTAGIGSTFTVKKIDASTNTVTVNITGGGTIDGSTTYVMSNQYESATFVADPITSGNYIIINTNRSSQPLKILNTAAQITLLYDNTHSATVSVNSTGDLVLNPSHFNTIIGDGTGSESLIGNYLTASGFFGFQAQSSGTNTFGLGFNNGATFGGSAGSANGREVYIFDNQASAFRLGLSSTGTLYVGTSNTNYTLAVNTPSGGATTGVTISATGVLTTITGTATDANLNMPAGTKKTTMVQGDWSASTGHLYYHDGSTDYDFLGVNGTSSGTYTPTATAVTNISTATPVSVTHYARNGNEVSVDGAVICTFTSTSTPTQLDISFPVASTITSVNDCLGGVYGASNGTSNGIVNGNTTSHRASLFFNSPSSGGVTVYYHFTFTVK